MPLIEINDVTKRYHKGDETITPLDGVTLSEIEEGEFLALMGASGTGQVDAAEPGREHRQARQWHDCRGWSRHHQPFANPTGELACGQHGLHFSDAQSGSRPDRIRKHRVAAVAAADVPGASGASG